VNDIEAKVVDKFVYMTNYESLIIQQMFTSKFIISKQQNIIWLVDQLLKKITYLGLYLGWEDRFNLIYAQFDKTIGGKKVNLWAHF
jgi:hypothetical protein